MRGFVGLCGGGSVRPRPKRVDRFLFEGAAAACYFIGSPGASIDGRWRRTQVVKGEVCKTSIQRFESARRLQIFPIPAEF